MDGVDVHLASSAVVGPERIEAFGLPRISVGTPLEHGRVRYEGMLYVMVPHHSQPLVDLDELCLHAADRRGYSRYGTFGRSTWYGALDPDTAIAETCYHMLADPADADDEPTPFGLYKVGVRGRFADLYGREHNRPEIIGDDYGATQALARETRKSTLCGVLYPSARSDGACLAVFTRKALRSARFVDVISIRRLGGNTVRVRPPWSATWQTLHRHDLRRVSSGSIPHAEASLAETADQTISEFPRIAMPVRVAGKQSAPAALVIHPTNEVNLHECAIE
jgi:hypothetical protein